MTTTDPTPAATVAVTFDDIAGHRAPTATIDIHNNTATCLADLDDNDMADLHDAIALEVETRMPRTPVHIHIGAGRIGGRATNRVTSKLLATFILNWNEANR